MTRAAAWLLVRLRLLVLPAWILLAVVVSLQLPAFTDQAEGDLGGLVASGSDSVKVEERGIREFGTPLLSRVAVVQRDPGGLSSAAQRRTLDQAIQVDRHRDPVLRSIAFALPVSNARGLATAVAGERDDRDHVPLLPPGRRAQRASSPLPRRTRAGFAPRGIRSRA